MPDLNAIYADSIRFILQLMILGIAGGAISWFYSSLQKKREIRRDILKDLSSLYGKFLSLRYRYNSFHIDWAELSSTVDHQLSTEDQKHEKWKHYEEACSLIGEFQGIKPLLISQFPKTENNITFLHSQFQNWRRRIGADKPILQEADGKSDASFKELRQKYNMTILHMRKRV